MPYLVQTSWCGRLHHSIVHQKPTRPREHLETETARLLISDREADQGIDALVRANFPEIGTVPADLGGEHF